MPTVSEFKARFTEFESVSDARVQIFLNDAALQISESKLGVYYPAAVANLAAHLLVVADRASGSQVVEEQVDKVRVKYADASARGRANSTGYLAEYHRLLNLCSPTPCVLYA